MTAGAEKAPQQARAQAAGREDRRGQAGRGLNAKVVEKKEVTAATPESDARAEAEGARSEAGSRAARAEDRSQGAREQERAGTENRSDRRSDQERRGEEAGEEGRDQAAAGEEAGAAAAEIRSAQGRRAARQARPRRVWPRRAPSLNTTASLGHPQGQRGGSCRMNEIDAVCAAAAAILEHCRLVWRMRQDRCRYPHPASRPDGSLAATPKVDSRGSGRACYDAVRDSAMRAVLRSAPFNMLHPAEI